jgi:putative membrane protein
LGALGLILFLYPFGVAFVAGGLLPERFSWTASVVIALNGIVVLLSELRVVPARKALGVFAVFVGILFGVEYVGSRTSIPFGAYAYTDTLGLTIAGVPPVIAIAWYGTVVSGWRIVQGIAPRAGRLPKAVLAGILAMALDIVLEPVAAEVERYWLWEGGSVPLQNYVSWFAFTFLAVLFLERTAIPMPHSGLVKSALLIFTLQWTLFVLTNLVHGAAVAVVVSVVLLGAVAAGSRLLPEAETRERHP